MVHRICSCGCGKFVGVVAYTIRGQPEEYATRECLNQVLDTTKRRRPMRVPSTEFAGAGATRHQCDNCHSPIALCFQGRDGEYCSNACLEKSEGGSMSDDNATAASPAIAGKTKKLIKKTVAAPAKTVKAAAPAPKKLVKVAPVATKSKAAAPAPKKKSAPASGRGLPAGELFRPGSTKADLWDVLKDGKVHPKKDVHAICDAANKSRQLLVWVLIKLKEQGYVVKSDRESIQVSKK